MPQLRKPAFQAGFFISFYDDFFDVGAVAAPDAAASGYVGGEVGGAGEKDVLSVGDFVFIVAPESEAVFGQLGKLDIHGVAFGEERGVGVEPRVAESPVDGEFRMAVP